MCTLAMAPDGKQMPESVGKTGQVKGWAYPTDDRGSMGEAGSVNPLLKAMLRP